MTPLGELHPHSCGWGPVDWGHVPWTRAPSFKVKPAYLAGTQHQATDCVSSENNFEFTGRFGNPGLEIFFHESQIINGPRILPQCALDAGEGTSVWEERRMLRLQQVHV